jgi:GT2 family glycosyltransferase
MLDLAVIIVSWNVRDYLANCLRSLFAEFQRSGLQGQVWVVENASTDGTVELLQDLFPQVQLLINDENPGFGAANNQGMAAAAESDPAYYFLLNPDTLVGAGSLTSLVDCLEQNPRIGLVGARLLFGDGRFQHSAFGFPRLRQLAFDLFPMPARLYESRLNGRYPRHQYDSKGAPFAIDHPLGATMMARAEVFEATGGFDESFHMYCEEIDWCWRIREKGWQISLVPGAEIIHYGGASTKQVQATSVLNLWRSRSRLYRKHYGPLTNFLAYHLVRIGMRRNALREDDPALKRAYEQISTVWRSANGW